MTQYTPQPRALAPLPDYGGAAVFLASCALTASIAYLIVADWIASNLLLNTGLIIITCALISYCARTTWCLYRTSELLDTLDGTVELGRTRRSELLQLSADAHKLRHFLDLKSLRAIIQSIQARGDFEVNPHTAQQLRRHAEQASQKAERSTDAGMLLVPLLAMSMGAWAFVSDGAAGTELNAAIMSPLIIGFLSAALLVLLNKHSQYVSLLFIGHFNQWLTLRCASANDQEREIAALRTSIKQLERKVQHSYRLTKQHRKALNAIAQNQVVDSLDASNRLATPVLMNSQKIIQQAADTRRVIQATRKEDNHPSLPMEACNDEHDQRAETNIGRSAAA